MRRRDLIALLAGTAYASPGAAGAQARERMQRIDVPPPALALADELIV